LSQANYSQEDITEVLAAIIEKMAIKNQREALKNNVQKSLNKKKSSLTAWIINQMIKRQNS
jgi:hypothetical protein